MPLFAYLTLHLWAKYPSWLQRSGIQASTSHYGILISEFGSGFEWRIALRLFDELEAAGIQVSSEPATYSYLKTHRIDVRGPDSHLDTLAAPTLNFTASRHYTVLHQAVGPTTPCRVHSITTSTTCGRGHPRHHPAGVQPQRRSAPRNTRVRRDAGGGRRGGRGRPRGGRRIERAAQTVAGGEAALRRDEGAGHPAGLRHLHRVDSARGPEAAPGQRRDQGVEGRDQGWRGSPAILVPGAAQWRGAPDVQQQPAGTPPPVTSNAVVTRGLYHSNAQLIMRSTCTPTHQAIGEAGQVAVPTYNRDIAAKRHLIYHMGVGGFHRSHQAFYLHQLLSLGKAAEWGLVGVGLLPHDRGLLDALERQDCLYTLSARAPSGPGAARQ
eukprot:1195509-Prorocentrum_minimum.AAC.1